MSQTIAPPKFRGVNFSQIRWVRLEQNPPSFTITNKAKRVGRAKALGIRYEKHVQKVFLDLSNNYIASPWLLFQCSQEKPRWCQPDGFFLDIKKGLITLVEIKYKHTSDAWWQLRRLYEPLIRFMFPFKYFNLALLEVVSWYDPAVKFPERYYFAADPLETKVGEIGIHIFSKGSKLSQKVLEKVEISGSNKYHGI